MRYAALSLFAIAITAGSALAQGDPKAIIEKAIEAHGGKKQLEKYPAAKVSFTGEMSIMGNNATVTGTNTSDKGKIKIELELAIAGQTIKILQMANGDKTMVRVNVGGMNIDAPVTEAQREELKQATLYAEVMSIVPLHDGKRFELKSLGSETIDKQKLDVVEVTIKDIKRSVKLYFDEKTHLLMQVSREGILPGDMNDKKGNLTTVLGDYKKVDDIMVPMKIVSKVEDEVFMTAKVTEHTNLEKIDAKEFAIDD